MRFNNHAAPVLFRTLRTPVLLAFFLFLAAAAHAQYGSKEELQTFDYNPDAAEEVQIQKERISVDYSEADIITDPMQGVYLVSKNRWKNWVARSTYLFFIYAAFMVILLSLPKTEEYNMIMAYILAGSEAALSFWTLLCAWLLFRLDARAWLAIFPLSLAMGAATYMMVMKIKRYDISLSELKESFQRMRAMTSEDKRLVSVENGPGDWPDADFVK